MSDSHAELLAHLRATVPVGAAILDAFARVPRHHFLPGVERAYVDDAIVTRDEDGVPTSSSSQPSLMARMLDLLDLAPGHRVLEVGTGTGYNAALLAALGTRVTSVELQPDVAAAARDHLAAAGADVDVVAGDGASPPAGPYDRIIVTAALWAIPAALADTLADGGVLVAPLRINGLEAVFALRRDGERLHASGSLPCGFMPLRGGDAGPWRWRLGSGGHATADADLGVEGRGNLDRVLATAPRVVEPAFGAARPLDALLWVSLQGDPLIPMGVPGAVGWHLALDVLPASVLVLWFVSGYSEVGEARLHGGDGALRALDRGVAAWAAAGSPGPPALELAIEPYRDRDVWSLPYPSGGVSRCVRGAHRWTFSWRAAAG